MSFDKCIELCNHHHDQDTEQLHISPTLIPHFFCDDPVWLYPISRLSTGNHWLHYVPIVLPLPKCYINEITQYLVIESAVYFCFVECIWDSSTFLHVSILLFFLLLNRIPLCEYNSLFIHSLVEVDLCCLQFLIITNVVTFVNIHVHSFKWTLVFISFEMKYLGMGLLGCSELKEMNWELFLPFLFSGRDYMELVIFLL